jgi:hypothetical protein
MSSAEDEALAAVYAAPDDLSIQLQTRPAIDALLASPLVARLDHLYLDPRDHRHEVAAALPADLRGKVTLDGYSGCLELRERYGLA